MRRSSTRLAQIRTRILKRILDVEGGGVSALCRIGTTELFREVDGRESTVGRAVLAGDWVGEAFFVFVDAPCWVGSFDEGGDVRKIGGLDCEARCCVGSGQEEEGGREYHLAYSSMMMMVWFLML